MYSTDDTATDLAESYIDGNISYVMDELNKLTKFEAMLMTLLIIRRFTLDSTRESFERAIRNRT